MELMHNYQVSINELLTEQFDYFIAASGYQKRSTYLAEQSGLKVAEKYVICFDESDNKKLRTENCELFDKLGFISINTTASATTEIERLIDMICSCRTCQNLNILVDYSCMPKIWYAAFINHLLKNNYKARRINIYFSYTSKKINVLNQKSKLKSYEPVFVQSDMTTGDKPVALVTGLNNNLEIVKELIERLKPTETIAFIPEFSHDSEYYSKILESNAPILKKVGLEKVFKYPAQKPDQIGSMLTSLCLDLRLNSNVMLVPHGPKTLSLASILLSVRYPDIKIYDLKPKDEKAELDIGLPSGEPVVLKSVFVVDDDEEDY